MNPLAARNALLLTAGYAPAYGEAPLDAGELALLTTLTRFGTAVDVTVKRAGKSSSRVCFTVQSETFCYNTGETTPAMNYCAAPISPGLWVRVSYHYYGNPILRLEAREEAVDPANVSEQ